MFPFMFVIDSIPLPQNPNFGSVAGAKVHICVVDNDISSAQQKAMSYVEQYFWNPKEIELSFEMPQEQLPLLETPEEALLRKAFRDGIAAVFYGYLDSVPPPETPILIKHP